MEQVASFYRRCFLQVPGGGAFGTRGAAVRAASNCARAKGAVPCIVREDLLAFATSSEAKAAALRAPLPPLSPADEVRAEKCAGRAARIYFAAFGHDPEDPGSDLVAAVQTAISLVEVMLVALAAGGAASSKRTVRGRLDATAKATAKAVQALKAATDELMEFADKVRTISP